MDNNTSLSATTSHYLSRLSTTNRWAHLNTFLSFMIGTIILLVYVIHPMRSWIDIGITYLFIAFCWNCLLLLFVIIRAIRSKTSYKETAITILVMLLNIPVAFLYFYVVIELQF